MVVDRRAGTIAHRRFTDLPDLIAAGDLLVANRSKVVKARLLGTRDGSGAPAEIFLLNALGDGRYEAMVSPGGKLKPGRVVHFAADFSAEIIGVTERRTRGQAVFNLLLRVSIQTKRGFAWTHINY